MPSRRVETDGCCPPVLEAPLGEADAKDLARVFAALADPVRLRLLNLIATTGEVCSCELLAPLGRSQPTVSHHTKVLADAGLIAGEKRGRWVWWSVVAERVADVHAALASAEPARA
jgi:ArsR family transcriptional regulator